jgi:hypothetical protein
VISLHHATKAAEDVVGQVADICHATKLVGALARRSSEVSGVELLLHPMAELDMFEERVGCKLDDRLRDLAGEENVLNWAEPKGMEMLRYSFVHVATRVPVRLHVARDPGSWTALVHKMT